jgi:acyl-coenzyme A synthetase/AMP-(fatty) acid ligase
MRLQNFGIASLLQAEQRPDAAAFVSREGTISYRQFADQVVHFAGHMQALGVRQGSVVGLAINSPSTMLVAVAALSALGAGWFVVSGDYTVSAFPGAVDHVFSAGTRSEQEGWHAIDASWLDAPPVPAGAIDALPGHAAPDAVWNYATSSGTTGRPKTMPVTYGTVWTRSTRPELADGLAQTVLNLFPAVTHVGVRFSLCNLAFGGTNVAMMQWPELVAAGVTKVLGSPSHMSSVFQRHPVPDIRIPACRVTGGPVTPSLMETGLDYFDEMQILYGSTEAGTMALGHFSRARPYDGTVGPPVAGVTVEALGADGQPNPPGTEGILRIRTDTLIPGYLGHPDPGNSPVRDGWLYPGDLGLIDANGALRFTGRADDVINTGGNKINAIDIDAIIERHPDVVDGYCFLETNAFGHGVLSAIVQLRRGAAAESLRSIKADIIDELHHSIWPRKIYLTDRVPRNINGKAMRSQAIALAPSLPKVDLP